MTAQETLTRLGISPWGYSDKHASITLQDATVRGHAISVSAAAEDENPLNNLPSWANKLFFDPLFQVPSISSTATFSQHPWSGGARTSGVTVQDSHLIASGNVSLATNSAVDASVEAISTINCQEVSAVVSHVAIAFSRGIGTAQTLVSGNTTIQSGDSVTISSRSRTRPWRGPRCSGT